MSINFECDRNVALENLLEIFVFFLHKYIVDEKNIYIFACKYYTIKL